MAIEFDLTTGTFQTPNNSHPADSEQRIDDGSDTPETRLEIHTEQSGPASTHPCVVMAACFSLGK